MDSFRLIILGFLALGQIANAGTFNALDASAHDSAPVESANQRPVLARPAASLDYLKRLLQLYYSTDDLTGGTRSDNPSSPVLSRLAGIDRALLSYQYPEKEVPQAILDSLKRGHVSALPPGIVSLTGLSTWAGFFRAKMAEYHKPGAKTADYPYFCWLLGEVVGEIGRHLADFGQDTGLPAIRDALLQAYEPAKASSFNGARNGAGDFLKYGLQLGDVRASQKATRIIDDYAHGRSPRGPAESDGVSNLLTLLSDAISFNQVDGPTRSGLLKYFAQLSVETNQNKITLPYGALNAISFP